jgi:hypothetical protein
MEVILIIVDLVENLFVIAMPMSAALNDMLERIHKPFVQLRTFSAPDRNGDYDYGRYPLR